MAVRQRLVPWAGQPTEAVRAHPKWEERLRFLSVGHQLRNLGSHPVGRTVVETSRGATKFGAGFKTTGSSNYQMVVGSGSALTNGVREIFVAQFRIDALPSGTAYIFGCCTNFTSNPSLHALYVNASGQVGIAHRAGGSALVAISASRTHAVGDVITAVGVSTATNSRRIYLATGERGSSSSSAASTNPGHYFAGGHAYSGNYPLLTIGLLAHIDGVPANEDEFVRKLLHNPYAELVEPRRVWIPVSAGGGAISGVLGGTLDAVTLAATGTLTVRGSLAATLVGATVAASGSLATGGTVAATLAGATLAAAGSVALAGSLGATLAPTTLAAAGSLPLAGAVAATLGSVALAATGASQSSGNLSATLADTTVAGTGVLSIAGTLTATLGNVSLTGTGTLPLSGVVMTTLDTATLTAAGTTAQGGSVSVTLGDATLAAAGSLTITGNTAATLQDTSLAATAALTVRGAAAVALDAITLASTGSVSLAGVLAAALDAVGLAAAGLRPATGTLTVTLEDAAAAAEGGGRTPTLFPLAGLTQTFPLAGLTQLFPLA